MAVKFQDDDDGYLEWVSTHPNGFVLNCERHPKPDYLFLHATSCHSITRLQPAGRRWTKSYVKVCSDSVSDVEAWVRENVVDGLTAPCPICSPGAGPAA
jgi:hypothetical protein